MWPNIQLKSQRESSERKGKTKIMIITEEIVAKNVPNLMKTIKLQVNSPIRRNIKKTIPSTP